MPLGGDSPQPLGLGAADRVVASSSLDLEEIIGGECFPLIDAISVL